MDRMSYNLACITLIFVCGSDIPTCTIKKEAFDVNCNCARKTNLLMKSLYFFFLFQKNELLF